MRVSSFCAQDCCLLRIYFNVSTLRVFLDVYVHKQIVCGVKPSALFLGQLHLPTGTLELITHGAVEAPQGFDQKHSAP